MKVPVKETMCWAPAVPPESATAEMFKLVILTESPSAACESIAGKNRSPNPIAAISTSALLEYPSLFRLILGEDLNTCWWPTD